MTLSAMPIVDHAAATDQHFALLAPGNAPAVAHSSPHVVDFERFVILFGGSPRRDALISMLREALDRLVAGGITPFCLLVGGGFTRDGAAPGDLDALVVYGLAANAPPEATQLLRHRVEGLDLRFVPADAHPALLVKMSCFFHTLYQSRDRDGNRPSFLILWGGA